jgi:hypothetical protein
MTKIKGVHPLADAFPILMGDEFDALVASIKDHGLRRPVVTDVDGWILDGRNRYAACEKLGIEPISTNYDGDDPLSFILDENVHRRHMNETQRAYVAARLANLGVGRPQINSANLPNYVFSREKAAALLNVSVKLVGHARKVLDSGDPTLVEGIKNGTTAVSKAAKSLRQPKGGRAVRDGKKDSAEQPRPPDPAPPEPRCSKPSENRSEPDDVGGSDADETPDVGEADIANDIIDDQDTAVTKLQPAPDGVEAEIAVVAVIEQYGMGQVFEVMKTFGEKEHGEDTPWNAPILNLKTEINSLKQELAEALANPNKSEQSTTSTDSTLHAFKTIILDENDIDWRAKSDELLEQGITQQQYVDGNRPDGQ